MPAPSPNEDKKMKVCASCSKDFEPRSRHKNCPQCRHISYKTPCEMCGKLTSKKHTFCVNCYIEQGLNKGNGKSKYKEGDTRLSSKGYILEKYTKHPRASRDHFVLQHILVMEKKLGRYIVRGEENVHHINGVKDDNRIENLELWIKPQPSGIRAKDAVIWAKKIIKKYGELK